MAKYEITWKDIIIIVLIMINIVACYMIGYYKINGVMP